MSENLNQNILDCAGSNTRRQIVINWHLTEACNYKCDFCYAKWVKAQARELIHDKESTQSMLVQLFDYFGSQSNVLALNEETPWESVRLNFAGGEPLLYRKETLVAVNFARDLGFDVSMITNGSFLDRPLLAELAPKLSLLGISLDSAHEDVNLAIGRADKRTGQTLGIETMENLFRFAREFNPALRLKINTVVNKLNWQEDMTDAIQRLMPDKWKVLQMLPIQNSNLSIRDFQFQEFVDRHGWLNEMMSVENNESMTESYIMIDPVGRFYQNAPSGQGQYRYSRPILQVGVREAFSEMSWSMSKFLSRYSHTIKAKRKVQSQKSAFAGVVKYPFFPIPVVAF